MTNQNVRNGYELLQDLLTEAAKTRNNEEPITVKQLAFLKSLAARSDMPAQQRRFLITYLARPNKSRMGARKIIWITKQKLVAAGINQ